MVEIARMVAAMSQRPGVWSGDAGVVSVPGRPSPPGVAVAGSTAPVGESATMTATKPPILSSSGSQVISPLTTLQFWTATGIRYSTSTGGAMSRSGGALISVTQ